MTGTRDEMIEHATRVLHDARHRMGTASECGECRRIVTLRLEQIDRERDQGNPPVAPTV